MVFATVFHELAAVVVVAAMVAFLGRLLRQPVIVSLIAAGILVGPSGLNMVHSVEHFDLLAQFGVALLLFVVGLKLDLHLIRSTGGVALTTGLGQVLFTSALGFLICLGLGLAPLAALYVAVALTFSSTIIVVKLLSDKGEIDALHGRVALGFLIVQDLVVVIAMIVLSSMGVGVEARDGTLLALVSVLAGGLVMVGATVLFSRYLAHRTLAWLASSQELLVLMAIGLAVALAALGDRLGFSKELGAFLGGVALASSPYREVLSARLTSLRDFLLVFFFIGMALHVDLGAVAGHLGPAALLSAFVLVGNPLIVMAIMGVMGYRARTGFLAGLTVAQISEFSLIFANLGFRLGHLDGGTVGLVTLVGLVTIALSTYMILYSHVLYRRLAPWLGVFERTVAHREILEQPASPAVAAQIILFGLGHYGRNLERALAERGCSVLGVDFDPEAVRTWQRAGKAAIYGDALDPGFLATLPLGPARWVVSTIPTRPTALTEGDPAVELPQGLRALGYGGRIAVVSYRPSLERARIVAAGADLVLVPFADAARQAAESIARP